MQHGDKPKEPIKSSNPPIFSSEIKTTVKEAERHDEVDEYIDAIIADLADDNKDNFFSGSADMHQENDYFCFQDENFIENSNKRTYL